MAQDEKDEGLPEGHRGIRSWIIKRFALKPIADRALFRRVPNARWYYGDGAALLLLFGILLITGAFLSLMYSPAPATAYESVRAITEQHKLGWFVRALHYWSAGMMVVVLLHHLLRHILLGGYLPPREGTWIVGVLMFILVIVNSYLGYTLRWDERAVYAIRVALNMFYQVPFIGERLVVFLQGGWDIGVTTLSRFYSVHVVFVPLLFVTFVAYHLYLIIYHGVTTIPERIDPVETAEDQKKLYDQLKHSKKHGTQFYPYTMFESWAFSLVVFAIVLTLTLSFGPAELYPEANFIEDSRPIEEWWWHWYSALIAHLPPAIAPYFYWMAPLGLIILLLTLPLIDHGANRGLRHRPIAVLSSVAVVVGILALTGQRLRSPWTAWPRSALAPLPRDIQLTESGQRGHQLFSQYGCFNCHALGGHGAEVGPNLTALEVRLSADELKHFILQPPEHAAMPAYKNRISEADLSSIVDFVLVAQTFPRQY